MASENVRFLSGNEACAEGAVAAGCRFFAGYPISPSSEIAEKMSGRLPKIGGKFIQMEDEIASIGAIIGARLAGLKAMTATSGPGFSLMQENLGYAAMAEVPIVLVNVMRGGPSTGNPTGPSQSDVQQCRWGTHGDHPAVVLSPSTVPEAFACTVHCFNFAERLRTPTVLAMDEIVAHMREKLAVPESVEQVWARGPSPQEQVSFKPYAAGEDLVPPWMNYGEGARYHVTGLDHDETGFPSLTAANMESLHRRLLDKVERNKKEILLYENFRTEDAEVLVVAYGSTARSAKRAVNEAREKGVKAGLFRPVTLYPVPEEELAAAARSARKVVVPEMNLGQYVLEVERILGKGVPIARVNLVNGEPITPASILSAIVGG
ncbi:MAG: 2-oxoacid:acceptor oxidoreductase subunit alpha [Acidobacteriota bacterium]